MSEALATQIRPRLPHLTPATLSRLLLRFTRLGYRDTAFYHGMLANYVVPRFARMRAADVRVAFEVMGHAKVRDAAMLAAATGYLLDGCGAADAIECVNVLWTCEMLELRDERLVGAYHARLAELLAGLVGEAQGKLTSSGVKDTGDGGSGAVSQISNGEVLDYKSRGDLTSRGVSPSCEG